MEMMALFTVLGFLFLFLKFGRGFMKRLIGMDAVADIVITIGLVFMFGVTGTISGMMAGIYAGVIISVLLFIAKRIFPHTVYNLKARRWEERGWFGRRS